MQLRAAEAVREMQANSGDRDVAVWESMGPTQWVSTSGYNPGNGRVNTVVGDPVDHQTIYIGTPSSGLWKSTDNGATWQAMYTDLPSMGVSGIAIDTSGTGALYIGTGDGDGADTYSVGVLKSTDDGATWNSTGLSWTTAQTRTTRALRIDPRHPEILYCAGSSGLYRTVDGGDNWTTLESGSFRDVEFMPGDSTWMYACTNVLYRSNTGGASFSTWGVNGLPADTAVGRMAIAVSPADPMTLYVLCSHGVDNSFLGLYRSTDGGSNFVTCTTSPNYFGYEQDGSDSGGQSWYDMALAVDPNDANVVYIGGVNVWKSTDGGFNFDLNSHWVFPSVAGYTHADIHSLDFVHGAVYCGSDGGIHVTNDAGATWDDVSVGLDITQFYRLGGSELLPDRILAGAQDNGTFMLDDGVWKHVIGADGMEAAVDPFDPQIVYGSSQNGGMSRAEDGGTVWTGMTDGIDEDGPWVTPYDFDHTAEGRAIAGFNNVWVTETRGVTWSRVSNWSTNQKMTCLKISPSDPAVMYAGRADLVQRTDDGGSSWVNIRSGLPNFAPTSFAVDENDPYHVWISLSGASPLARVFESFNGGAAWQNRTLNMPAIPVNCVVMQPGSPNGIYAATDVGVFYKDNYTTDWQPYGTGMPHVVVTELEINMAAGKLRASTFGRGIWQADLFFSPFANVASIESASTPRILPLDQSGRYTVQVDANHDRLIDIHVVDAMGRSVR
ncbi:MAG TPA: hypothetical protein PK760_00710, partial [Flavobacteriales bacterium]|nr:hypothetical protein [Flavobacteriales bacterium]